MKFSELPLEIQNKLNDEKANLHSTMKMNTAYDVLLVNKEGTRFFRAARTRFMYGASYWRISYGKTTISRTYDPLYGENFEWTICGKLFAKSANGTEIPRTINTKKEVMEIAKAIGIFEIPTELTIKQRRKIYQ